MNIILPDWYDDLFQFECEAKGCVLNLEAVVDKCRRIFNFYDISRFVQEAKDELNENGYFIDNNAVIIPKVTKENIMRYLDSLEWS